jgi:hypothetical protein
MKLLLLLSALFVSLLTFSLISAEDCSDNPSSDIDCLHNCSNNWIYDYTDHSCCPPTQPYYIGDYNGQGQCGKFANIYSDNYYTRKSSCYSYKNGNECGYCGGPTRDIAGCALTSCTNIEDADFVEKRCDGNNYQVCRQDSPFIFNYADLGIIKGKCDVECITQADCPQPVLLGNFCNGNILEERFTAYLCEDNFCYDETGIGKSVECVYGCENNLCKSQPPCIGDNCPKPFDFTILIILVSIFIAIILFILIYSKLKHKEGKN